MFGNFEVCIFKFECRTVHFVNVLRTWREKGHTRCWNFEFQKLNFGVVVCDVG